MNSFLTPVVYKDQYYSCSIFTKVIKSGFLGPCRLETSFYFVALKLNADQLLTVGENKVNSSFVLRLLCRFCCDWFLARTVSRSCRFHSEVALQSEGLL